MRLLLVTHFSRLSMATGMVKFMHYLAEYLADHYEVDVISLRDPAMPTVKQFKYTSYRGANSIPDISGYDLVIAHAPHNLINHPKLVQLFDTDKYQGMHYIDNPSVLNIYTTQHIKQVYDKPGIILHPIMYPELHRGSTGNKITIIGLSPNKGSEVARQLALHLPEYQFLGVQSGWAKERQRPITLPNFTTISEVEDMREIWSQTRILISPSQKETYGLANLEAMASGIPVIAHDCPGVQEALGDNAILMHNLYPIDWAQKIKLLDNPVEYQEWSKKSLTQSQKVDSAAELDNLKRELDKL